MQMSYNETRTSPVLERAEEYEMAIVRYSLPLHLLPCFIYDPTKYELGFDGVLTALNDFVNPENSHTDIRKNYVLNVQTWLDYLNSKINALKPAGDM